MAHLAREAQRRGLEMVVANLTPTAKNEPARRFLHEIGARFEQKREAGFSYRLPAGELSGLQWKAPLEKKISTSVTIAQPVVHKRPDYARIASTLSTPFQILEAMRYSPTRQQGAQDTEARLAQIWSELLQKPHISSADNFFDLGGHSLLAVLLIVRVRETFGVELAIDDVYSVNLTLGELAAKIERDQLGSRATYENLYKEIDALSDEEVKQLLAAEDPGVPFSDSAL
jgi:acyl carrier protein